MSALKPGLLDRLRQERINIDWRRERPHPDLGALRAEFGREVEEGRLDHCERVEAGALLSRLALEPLATLQGLIDVLEAAPSRSSAALRLLQELSFQWGAAMATLGVGSDGEKARQVAHHSATVWMRRLAKRYPQDRRVQHAVAVFLRRGHSRSALFQHVERQAEPCPEVVAEYLDAVIDALSRNPDSNMLKRAFLEPLPFKAPFNFDLVCFRFHRAVVAHVLIWNCDFRASFGNAALRAGLLAIPKPNPASELEAVRRLLSLQPWDSQAECVIRLSKCPAIWSCPDLEAVRLGVLDLATSIVPHVQNMDAVKRLLRCLIEYAPQTVDFWEDPARPRQLHELVVAQKNKLSPAVYGSFIALTAFALPDLDMVACGSEASAAGSISSPSQLTYLDLRKVAPRTSPILLNADRFSFEAADMSFRPDGFVVATSADENYFRIHAMTWAESLHRSGSGADVHFHIIGAPDAISSEMAAVRKALAGRRVTFSHEVPLIRRAFYYASARLLRSGELLRHFGCSLMVTDIDIAWTVPPEALAASVPEADVALRVFDCVRHYVRAGSGEVILRYPRLTLSQCTSASCYLLLPSPAGHRFADLLADVASQHLVHFLEKPGSHWFIDQNILSAVLIHSIRHDPDMRLGNLDACGLGLSGFALLDDERLRSTHGRHWMMDGTPHPNAAGSLPAEMAGLPVTPPAPPPAP